MALKDVVGQGKATGRLLGAIARGRTASAYLFGGEPGIGKKMAAIEFAKALNCQKAANHGPDGETAALFAVTDYETLPSQDGPHSPDVDACDECESCLKIAAGTHPDFLLVSSEERQIRIEEIRTVQEALSFKPFEGRKKVVIIDDADTMNGPAANAFLKTLEEPPGESVIVLVSSRPERLPATIRSRCSRVGFSPLPSAACRQVLSGRIDDKDVDSAVRLSMGRPGLALSADLAEERDRFMNLLKAMLGAEKDGWVSREDMDLWFDHALFFFRDMAVLKVTGSEEALINGDLSAVLANLGKSLDVAGIIIIYRELVRLKGMLMFNLNKSVTWNYAASLLRKELSLDNA